MSIISKIKNKIKQKIISEFIDDFTNGRYDIKSHPLYTHNEDKLLNAITHEFILINLPLVFDKINKSPSYKRKKFDELIRCYIMENFDYFTGEDIFRRKLTDRITSNYEDYVLELRKKLTEITGVDYMFYGMKN